MFLNLFFKTNVLDFCLEVVLKNSFVNVIDRMYVYILCLMLPWHTCSVNCQVG